MSNEIYTHPKAPHVVNDYRYQREVSKGSNHDRMIQRKINRESMKINV